MVKCTFNSARALVLAGLFATFSLCAQATNEPSVLTGDQIIQKAVARAESPATHQLRPDYVYTKHTLTEDLDLKGHVKNRKEKLYEVSVESGFSYLKLLQYNGQNLTPVELKKQEEKETAERQKMTDAKPGQKGDERENFLTADLAQRFNFSRLDSREINGRLAYEIVFDPKPDLVNHKLTDRFVNQMTGTVWIDAEDFEIARAEVHLKSEVTLWGGMIGTLRYCKFTLERTRLEDGTWFNSSSHGIFEGRKLIEPMLIRTRSTSEDFHRPSLAIR